MRKRGEEGIHRLEDVIYKAAGILHNVILTSSILSQHAVRTVECVDAQVIAR